MTPEQARDAAAVLLAYAEGKTIQWRCVDSVTKVLSPPPWQDLEGALGFDLDHNEYRIKPSPREWWIVEGKHGHQVFNNRDAARCNDNFGSNAVVHVREVLE